jgi:hypothetical protein
MRRDLCRHEKAAPEAASIQDPFNSLLTADEESSRSSHDLWRHALQIVFPHEPKWDAVTEFRVQASEPGLDPLSAPRLRDGDGRAKRRRWLC